jgi:hypothetical protein
VSRDNIEVKFQNNAGPRKRAVALLSVFGAIVVIVGIAHADSSGIPAIVTGVAVLLTAYRTWVGGLFLTTNSVIIRNVVLIRRLSIGQVIRAEFVAGPRFARWSYIKIKMTGGAEVKVAALHRRPTDGDDLERSINAELTKRRSTM